MIRPDQSRKRKPIDRRTHPRAGRGRQPHSPRLPPADDRRPRLLFARHATGLLPCPGAAYGFSRCTRLTARVMDSNGMPGAGARVEGASLSTCLSPILTHAVLPSNSQRTRWVAVSKPGHRPHRGPPVRRTRRRADHARRFGQLRWLAATRPLASLRARRRTPHGPPESIRRCLVEPSRPSVNHRIQGPALQGQYARMTPMTTPWTCTLSTQIGS